MENRFNVILEEDLQGIPAGTSGSIVVKDDFKTMTIDFIAVGGKRIRIHEEPDSLLKKVKVIKPSDNNQSPSYWSLSYNYYENAADWDKIQPAVFFEKRLFE